MSDIPNPSFDALTFEAKQPVFRGELIHGFGASAVGGVYIDSSYHRPSYYEIEKGRGTTLVDMDTSGEITVPADEEGRIATFGLNGCSAVAISAEMPDGTRNGYVQHYSPLNKQLGASTLATVSDRLRDEGARDVRAVIMMPGEYTQDANLKWAMEPKDELLTGLLTTTIQGRLGAETEVQIYSYSEQQSEDQYGQGTLMVEFREDGSVNLLAEAIPVRPLNEEH